MILPMRRGRTERLGVYVLSSCEKMEDLLIF